MDLGKRAPAMKHNLSLLALLAALVATLVFRPVPTRASDPQPYALEIESTSNDTLDAAIASTSLLSTLHGAAAPPPFALIERARSDIARIQTVLNGRGYYAPHVSVTIAGHDVADPDLPGELDQVPQGSSVPVRVAVAA